MPTRNLRSTTVLATLISLTAATAFAADSPEQFLKEAMQGDNSEIMLGKLAEGKSTNPKVQDFGRTLVTDHGKARDEVATVATKLGVASTDQPAAEAQDEQAKLTKLSGAAFDSEFASYMVNDHEKDIKTFEEQANGQGPASDLAKNQLPVLRKHLDMAQAITKQLGNTTGAATSDMKTAATRESPDQWRASKLAGVPIYGPDNKKVGDITDVLVNKEGKAESVIIGVGGFLGIGEKDVAIAFDQVKFVATPVVTPTTDTGASPLGKVGATTTKNDPSMTATATRSAAYPDHGMIDMTADQLKQAPTFHFAS